MTYSDEHGYVTVDRDARYLLRFRSLMGVAIGIGLLVASIPAARDWVWRTVLPDDYARAHYKPVRDADLDKAFDAATARMRKCADGQVVLDTRCPDGSAGTPLAAQKAK